MNAEFQGSWVRRAGILVPVLDGAPKGGRPRKVTPGAVGRMIDLINWTPETVAAAHAAYGRGNRDVYVLAGQRVYDRERPRKRRGLDSETREWCRKQAVRGSWLQQERTNRMLESIT